MGEGRKVGAVCCLGCWGSEPSPLLGKESMKMKATRMRSVRHVHLPDTEMQQSPWGPHCSTFILLLLILTLKTETDYDPRRYIPSPLGLVKPQDFRSQYKNHLLREAPLVPGLTAL